MSNAKPIVYVLDDDSADALHLIRLFESVKLDVATFNDAGEFLAAYAPDRPACLMLDVRMPGFNGFDVLRRLVQENASLPVIMMTGHADVPTAVRALRAGALDFIEKPCNDQTVLDSVQRALRRNAECLAGRRRDAAMAARWSELSPREREVIVRLAAGATNQEIADELGVGTRTVETHRLNAMKKLDLRFGAEFIRVVSSHEAGRCCSQRDGEYQCCCSCRARSMGDPSTARFT